MMNILKVGLMILLGVGFGFGVDKVVNAEVSPIDEVSQNTEASPNDEVDYYGHMGGGYCFDDGDFIEHMLADLTDEELVLVQGKIDELLIEYAITLDELNDDYQVRYDFMDDLMNFLDENNIVYHNHRGFDDHIDEDVWHGGMGMH